MAALLVTLAPLVYFFPAVRGQIVISPDDGVIFNIPLRVAAANLMRAGHLPLWNPYIFSGMPLHGAAQAGLLFPLNWFYLVFSPPVATNLMMLATYMVAALGAYLFARRSGANITGALATSFIWQFSAFMVEQVGHTNVLQTAAMLPWVLWAVEGHVATGSRGRGVLLAALVAMLVFAGHQQTSAYALLVTAVYTLILVHASKKSLASYLSPLAMLGLGFLLAAVQILPTIELLRNSMRASASYDFFSSFSMPPHFALTMFAPYLFGGGNGLLFRAPYIGPTFFGEYVAYVGLLTIMLALLAIVLKPDVRTKFWAIVFVVCLLLAFGRFLPLHIYAVIYYVPVLNLFRVPARHLMEVEFALAVLAGRGITIIVNARGGNKALQGTRVKVALVGAAVFLLTCLTVTWWRPANFHLARQVPLTFLRAPELFLPVLMAAVSGIALWSFSRSNRRRASFGLLVVLLADLFVYGQGSGWRTSSPTSDSELWSEPTAVKFLRDREGSKAGSFRLLTADQRFDPAQPVPPPSAPGDWMLSLQPDVYMMHGLENAAGYDGFGLARYSRLAGDMKVWGELTEPERTLRSESREIDLLNVRYLLTRPFARASGKSSETSGAAPASSAAASPATRSSVTPEDFPEASQDFQGNKFAAVDLNLSHLDGAAKLVFAIPPVEVDHLALVTKLSWSVNIPDGAPVARVRLFTENGKIINLELRAGEHTAEWAHDRADIQTQIKHRRPPVAASYQVDDGKESYLAHSYLAKIALPERATVKGGEIVIASQRLAPDLLLDVLRMTLSDQAGKKSFALRREWFARQSIKPVRPSVARELTPAKPVSKDSAKTANDITNKDDAEPTQPAGTKHRWHQVAQLGNVVIFENQRVLPRAWLATDAVALKEPATIEVIRTARLPDGKPWDPAKTALLENVPELKRHIGDSATKVEITNYGPHRIALKAESSTSAILVLSENHYPGWRAYVDGRPVETLRVNYNLRGVLLAAGNHEVEFLYRPKSVLFGLGISLLTLLGLFLWWRRLIPGFVRVPS